MTWRRASVSGRPGSSLAPGTKCLRSWEISSQSNCAARLVGASSVRMRSVVDVVVAIVVVAVGDAVAGGSVAATAAGGRVWGKS